MRNESSNSVKKNYIFNVLNQIITIIFPMVLVPYISRVLGAESIGIYSYTLSVATIFFTIGKLGLDTYGQLIIAKNRDCIYDKQRIFSQLLSFRCLFLFFVLVTYIIFVSFFVEEYKTAYYLMSLLFFSGFFDITWLYLGLELFKIIAFRNLFIKILNFVCVLMLVTDAGKLYTYIFVMQFGTVISNLLLWFGVEKRCEVKLRFDFSIWHHFRPCFVYFIPTVANLIYNILDKTMLGSIGGSVYQSGCYEQAYKIISVGEIIFLTLGMTTLPRLTYYYSGNYREKISSIIINSLRFIGIFLIPMAFGIFSLSEFVVVIILGDGYDAAINVLQVLSLLMIFGVLNYTIGRQILMASGKQNKYNIGVLCGSVLNFLVNIILIKRYYAFGAAVSSLAAEIIIFVVFIYFTKDSLSIYKAVCKDYIQFSAASLAMGLCIWCVKNNLRLSNDIFEMLILVLLGSAIYFLALTIMKNSTLTYFKDIFISKVKSCLGRIG